MAEAGGMGSNISALASKVDIKIRFLQDVLAEYKEMKNVINVITKEKERLQQEKEKFHHEQHGNGEALAAMKEDLLASKDILGAARDALMVSTEEIARVNIELEGLKRKVQESETKNNLAEQQCRNATEPIHLYPGAVQTRSMDKRKRLSGGSLDYDAYATEYANQLDDQSPSHLESLGNLNVQTRSVEKQKGLSERPLGNDANNFEIAEEQNRQEQLDKPTVGQTSSVMVCRGADQEAVREELIKAFLKIDSSGRKFGIKEMGELSEKEFKAACLAKVPPEELDATFYQLYSSWQQQLSDLNWNPLKMATVDGNCQEIVNVDDDKLQELKRAWGEGAYNAVIKALMELKEYGRLSDRYITYELWNYSDERKATMRECVEYMCNQVKTLTVAKRRKSRRLAGRT